MTPPDRFSDATFATYQPSSPHQAAALARVEGFADALAAHYASWRHRLPQWMPGVSAPPAGLYLVGPVGTGKTHLMAALYQALHPQVPCAYLHSRRLFQLTEPPVAFAKRLAASYRVCCLDELEIDGPANEARVAHVLRTLAAQRVTLVATSNVSPDNFLAHKVGPGRFQRFLQETFASQYVVVPVLGDDYRTGAAVERSGIGWIGPAADQQLEAHYHAYGGHFLTFAEMQQAATHTAHEALMQRWLAAERLYLANISIPSTDAALRLLRIVDDLYTRPEAPALFFSAPQPPEAWFAPEAHAGVAGAIAAKFTRTVSRLRALCTIQSTTSHA